MKKLYINLMLASLAMWSLTSCSDFLDEKPTGSLTEDQVFSNIENVEPLVTGLYTTFRDCKAGRNGLMSSLGTDETQQGNFQLISSGDQAGLDKYNGQLNPTSTQVATIWNNRWPAVTSAAKAIYALTKTEESSRAKQLMGEASFIRGMLMYELSMFWGRIPIIDLERTKELGYGPQPEKEVWTYIINDFKTAVADLPESYESEPQRATKGAALAMLGRAYMSAPDSTGLRDYAKADECFQQIINMNRYQLLDSYADLWDYRNINTKESLFEIQFNNTWPNCNYWQFDFGSRACDSWFSQGCSFSGYDFLVPTPFCYKSVSEGGLWEEGDTRRDASIRYDFTYKTNKYSEDGSFQMVTPDLSKTTWTGTTDELKPHIKKWEDFRTDILSGLGINNMWNSGKNYPMVRYADVLLLHAECLNQLGKTSEAVTLINNTIRKRAFGGTLPANMAWNTGMSKEECFDKIMDERMRELCFESWRRIDLIRTGKLMELVLQRNQWARESGTMKAFHVRYPVPDTEIKTNEDYKPTDQNPGYSQDIE